MRWMYHVGGKFNHIRTLGYEIGVCERRIAQPRSQGAGAGVQAASHRLQLQIEQRAMRLVEAQAAFRAKVEGKGQEIATLPERTYRKFLRFNIRQREDMVRKVCSPHKHTRTHSHASLHSEVCMALGCARNCVVRQSWRCLMVQHRTANSTPKFGS